MESVKTKRVVFDNLICRTASGAILLNTYSFRRKVLSKSELDMLISIEKKLKKNDSLTQKERIFYEKLLNEKQVISRELIDAFEANVNEQAKTDRAHNLVSLAFNLSYKCNFKCEYCYQRQSGYNRRHVMSGPDIDKALEYLHEYGYERDEYTLVTISGGEPLLPSTRAVINYILDTVNARKYYLLTNGVYILSAVDQVDFKRFSKVQISLDGTQDVVTKINHGGEGDFNKIIEGIKYLARIDGLAIEIAITLTESLLECLPDFMFVLQREGVLGRVKLTFGYIENHYCDERLDTGFYSIEEAIELRKKANVILKNYNEEIPHFGALESLYYAFVRPLNSRMGTRYRNCQVDKGINFLFDSAGDVSWCSCMGHDSLLIGRYLDESERTFNRELLDNILNRTVQNISECRACPVKYICGGGCPLPLIKCKKPILSPCCGVFKNDYVWENMEEIFGLN